MFMTKFNFDPKYAMTKSITNNILKME